MIQFFLIEYNCCNQSRSTGTTRKGTTWEEVARREVFRSEWIKWQEQHEKAETEIRIYIIWNGVKW